VTRDGLCPPPCEPKEQESFTYLRRLSRGDVPARDLSRDPGGARAMPPGGHVLVVGIIRLGAFVSCSSATRRAVSPAARASSASIASSMSARADRTSVARRAR